MFLFNENNIKKTIFLSLISLVSLLSICFSILYIVEKHLVLEEELIKIEKNFMAQQQQLLKNSVDLRISIIDLHRRQVTEGLKETMANRLQEILEIAENLLNTTKSNWNSTELETLIRETLRPSKQSEPKRNIFAFSPNNTLHLSSFNSDHEQQRLSDLFPRKGLDFFNSITKSIENDDTFFQNACFSKKNNLDRKCNHFVYAEHFKPLNWFIGLSENLTTHIEHTKQDILKNIHSGIQKNQEDYFFVYRLNNINGGDNFATMLANPNTPQLIGKSLSDEYEDIYGKKFRKEFLAGLRENGESFVTYWYKKKDSDHPKKKLSYFKLYPEWGWIVAKGTYLDKLDTILNEKKSALESDIKRKLYIFFVFFCLIIALVLIITHYITQGINEILDTYRTNKKEQQRKLEEINQQLRIHATTDSLTKLYNRSFFNSQLSKELSRSKRYNYQLSLIMFDIDHFKVINDSFGHLQGDNVLRDLAKLVRGHIRKSDILARWGGEEFVLLTPGTDLQNACLTAEKLCLAISNHAFSIDQQVTSSFGVATFNKNDTEKSWLKRVDDALYKAKELGRNRVCKQKS